jgi:hypothetical protein
MRLLTLANVALTWFPGQCHPTKASTKDNVRLTIQCRVSGEFARDSLFSVIPAIPKFTRVETGAGIQNLGPGSKPAPDAIRGPGRRPHALISDQNLVNRYNSSDLGVEREIISGGSFKEPCL